MKLIERIKLKYKLRPPCHKCLYKLGLVHTFVNPCPQCRENGYKTYEQFKGHLKEDYLIHHNEDKK